MRSAAKIWVQVWAICMTGLLGACAPDHEPPASALTFGPGDSDDTAGDTDGGSDDDGDGSDTDAPEGGICLAHNCDEDLHCAGCDQGRTSCYLPEKRCVACDPETLEGCEEGETCTEFGYCVPEGQTCETDDEGTPTITCEVDADCAACDPDHQVCDGGSCVGCTADNTTQCLAVEHCSAQGECIANCPESCTADADCGQCGQAGHEAHACHNHRCAECSATVPCPDGQACNQHGACVEICGLPGQLAGTCDTDADCGGCPSGSQNCVAPINGGHGTCGAEAAGCSDLGEGVAVLPEPYDQVTNLCSNDADCSGVGIQYNVGKLLRELTGINEIDDAIIEYPMASCADVTVGVGDQSLSCGVCVPCQTDADCMDIDIDEVAQDAFGPLGALAAALLLDQLFGAESHQIHMYCAPVAAGYGACVPCPTLTSDCTAGGGGSGNGSCDHDVCATGGPLDPSCGACAANVCAVDGYCCDVEWDSICVNLVETHCAGSCAGGGSGGNCGHDQCTTGEPLDASCNTCTSAVCSADPYCCQTAWDSICVGLVETYCGGDCGGGGCIHSECTQGGPLASTCSSCAADVCGIDPYCCNTDWDAQCVQEAEQYCPTLCGGGGGGGGGGGCGHDECVQGAPLDPACSGCVNAICNNDPYCCDVQWDQPCVNAVDVLCTPGC